MSRLGRTCWRHTENLGTRDPFQAAWDFLSLPRMPHSPQGPSAHRQAPGLEEKQLIS